MELDRKDCTILQVLQNDCRTSLTDISRKVGLSIDATKKRMKKMQDSRVFYPRIQLRPRNFGFANVVDIKIKLQYEDEKEMASLVKYLREHPRVVEFFSVSGEWDMSIVIIARDALELGKVTAEIRNKFGRLISSWNASLTVNSYKFEEYDMERLMSR
jgi:DNA-binding Lrp family transcriptional regulator